jgi:hypothetical protein
VANLVGCVPFIPCFISGNSHPTIPYRFKDDRRIGHASADTQRGPYKVNLFTYKVNFWNLDVALRQGPLPDGVYC